jgi:hypothetical protein
MKESAVVCQLALPESALETGFISALFHKRSYKYNINSARASRNAIKGRRFIVLLKQTVLKIIFF